MKVILDKYKKFNEEVKKSWNYLQSKNIDLLYYDYEFNRRLYEERLATSTSLSVEIYILKYDDLPVLLVPVESYRSTFIFRRILNSKYLDISPVMHDTSYDFFELINQIASMVKRLPLVLHKTYTGSGCPPDGVYKVIKNNNLHILDLSSKESDQIIKKNEDKVRYSYQLKRINPVFQEPADNVGEIIEYKRKQLRDTLSRDYFSDSVYLGLFNNYTSLNRYRTTSVYLTQDKQFISGHIGFEYNNNYYYHIPSYNNTFKKYSPGSLLLISLIKNCKKNNIKYFSFGIGDEGYKYDYKCNIYKLTDLLSTGLVFGLLYEIYNYSKNFYIFLRRIKIN